MCQVFLMVAHNFTDQWALSIAVRKKKVEFVMGPNSIFYTHCSARTRPFESCCAAKYHLWNNPLVWYSIWIEILLRLISDTLSVQNTEAELPRGQLCPGARNPGAQERKLTNQPAMHTTETVHREQMEYKVNRITAAFWKINIYLFYRVRWENRYYCTCQLYIKCENGPLKD